MLALVAFAARQAPAVSAAPPTDLFFSEYLESQPGNRKAVEIYNGTASSITLTGVYNVAVYSNGSATPTSTIALTGSIAAGDVYVLSHTDTPAAYVGFVADLTSNSLTFNGDDAVALRNGTTLVDVIGQIGTDPGTEWGTGLASTVDNTIRRKSTICAGDTNGSDAFDPATEYDGFADGTFSGFGSHTASCGGGDTAPTVTSTSPANSATGVALAADVSVTFSEAVTVSGAWYTISCANSGAHTATVSGGPTTFTLNPDTNFTGGELCTVTIESTLVADQDGTADNMAADYPFSFTTTTPPAACGDPGVTLINAIQGTTDTSPAAGAVRTVEAIVVGDFQDTTSEPPNELNGYFLQEEDADGDANAATSEGIFVFEGSNPTTPAVAVGDKVRVTGTVTEFGDVDIDPNTLDTYTELVGPLTVLVCSSGNVLPTAASVDLPVTALTDYEAIESMRVTFPEELTVSEVYTLGRYGEVLLSAGGRLLNPTHAAEPGAAAQAVRDANILRSIYLDDGLTNQNPDPVIYPAPGLSASNTLRGGDTTTGLTGVMHYLDTTEDFRVQPTGTVAWDHENPRPADAPAVGDTLRIVGSNTLNYFITIDPNSNDSDSYTADDVCGPNYDGNTANGMECRGADSSQEFTRQRAKFLNALAEMDADVFGLMELENNAQANPAGDDNDPVLEDIVNGLNALVGAGTYDFIDTGTLGNDAIKVGLIYKPATVTPVGGYAVLDSSVDPLFDTSRNRPALAQTFEEIATGGQLTVVVNHFKSKGSCPSSGPNEEQGDLQGCWNPVRTDAATALVNWLATDPTDSGDPDFLVLGDLNSYAKEDPIDVFINAGYVDLADEFNADPYSYVFDGEWGYLDYALANPTLAAQVTDAKEWHSNADEPIVLDYNTEFISSGQIASFYSSDPFRWSDHDPILVGLNLTPPPDTTEPNSTITVFPPNPSNNNDPTFEFESNEPLGMLECVLDGDDEDWFICNEGEIAFTDLSDGSHTFRVRATDPSANMESTPASYTWVIDTTAPDTTITANPMNPSNSASASFSFTGNDGSGVGGVTFECQIDGGAWTACTSPQSYTGLSDGSHTFQVRAKDSLGNTDSSPASYTWVIDTAGPTVTINQATGQADSTSTSPINFTVVFSEAVSGFATGDVTLSGTAGATTATVSGGPTTYNVAVSGMTNSGTVIATIAANVAQDAAGNGNAASTSTDNTVTWVVPAAPVSIYVSTTTAGSVGGVPFGSEDILHWDGSAWSVWFDGSDAGLSAKNAQHNINAFYVPETTGLAPNDGEVLIAFAQNARVIPGITGKVDGMDIVHWDGSGFSLLFDGQDVGLTVLTAEKIDGLHELDPSLAPAAVKAAAGGACDRYFLISTAGNGKVTNYDGSQLKISGEDVLGFCATQLGATTAGKWHMLLDGSAQGVKPNNITGIAASADGQTLYLTSNKAFNVDGVVGGHSMVYEYDVSSGTFSGPIFSAPATGLGQKVDGLHMVGDIDN